LYGNSEYQIRDILSGVDGDLGSAVWLPSPRVVDIGSDRIFSRICENQTIISRIEVSAKIPSLVRLRFVGWHRRSTVSSQKHNLRIRIGFASTVLHYAPTQLANRCAAHIP